MTAFMDPQDIVFERRESPRNKQSQKGKKQIDNHQQKRLSTTESSGSSKISFSENQQKLSIIPDKKDLGLPQIQGFTP